MITEWRPPDEYDRVEVASFVRITPMSGLMVALSMIRSLVFLLLELGSLLTSLRTFGVVSGGVMLIMFALRVKFSPVEVSVLFLGLSSLFCLRVLLGPILLGWSLSRVFLKDLMLLRLLLGCLMPLLSGLMVVWFWIRSRVSPPLVLAFLLLR